MRETLAIGSKWIIGGTTGILAATQSVDKFPEIRDVVQHNVLSHIFDDEGALEFASNAITGLTLIVLTIVATSLASRAGYRLAGGEY